MKCNYKIMSQLTSSERQKLKNEMQKWIAEGLKEENDKMQKVIINNMGKLLVLSSNEGLGLGAKRIEKILIAFRHLLEQCENDEEFWLLNEERCREILTKEIYYKYFDDNPFILNK